MPVLFKKHLNNDTLIGVWHITETAEELLTLANLHEREQHTLETYKNENRKKQWLSYRALIRELVEENYHITYTDFGKPFLQISKKNKHVSISHAGTYAAVIINEFFPVGIDIEKSSPRIVRVSQRFLSDDELGFMDPANHLNHLTICWTAKEALFKLHGNTCPDFKEQIPLTPFAFCETGEIDSQIILDDTTEAYKVYFTKINDYFLAFVTDTKKG